jgi:hypothetical protein
VAVFESAALIVDRYLSGIDWKASPVEVSPLPPPEPPTPTQLLVELGASAGLGITGYAPEGELGLGIAYGAFFAELEGLFLGFGSQTTDVLFTQQTWAVQAALGVRPKLGPGHLRIEALGGVQIYSITASWADMTLHPCLLPHPASALVPMPFGGVRLGYMFSLSERLSLGLRVSARIHGNIRINAADASLVSHLADGEVTLALGYLFF